MTPLIAIGAAAGVYFLSKSALAAPTTQSQADNGGVSVADAEADPRATLGGATGSQSTAGATGAAPTSFSATGATAVSPTAAPISIATAPSTARPGQNVPVGKRPLTQTMTAPQKKRCGSTCGETQRDLQAAVNGIAPGIRF